MNETIENTNSVRNHACRLESEWNHFVLSGNRGRQGSPTYLFLVIGLVLPGTGSFCEIVRKRNFVYLSIVGVQALYWTPVNRLHSAEELQGARPPHPLHRYSSVLFTIMPYISSLSYCISVLYSTLHNYNLVHTFTTLYKYNKSIERLLLT